MTLPRSVICVCGLENIDGSKWGDLRASADDCPTHRTGTFIVTPSIGRNRDGHVIAVEQVLAVSFGDPIPFRYPFALELPSLDQGPLADGGVVGVTARVVD